MFNTNEQKDCDFGILYMLFIDNSMNFMCQFEKNEKMMDDLNDDLIDYYVEHMILEDDIDQMEAHIF